MSYHGALSLTGESPLPPWSPWRPKSEGGGGRWWITLDEGDALFLPSEYKSNFSCIFGDEITIGTPSQSNVYELSRDWLR